MHEETLPWKGHSEIPANFSSRDINDRADDTMANFAEAVLWLAHVFSKPDEGAELGRGSYACWRSRARGRDLQVGKVHRQTATRKPYFHFPATVVQPIKSHAKCA